MKKILSKEHNDIKFFERLKSLVENEMNFKRRKKEKGFTLIEVLITIMILGMVLISLISCFIYGFNVLARTKRTSIATQCVQKEVENIRSKTFAEILALGNTWTNENFVKLDNATGVRAIEDSGIGADIKKLTISLTWTYRGRTMEQSIVTYITKEGINKK